jgi:hypothetical protein
MTEKGNKQFMRSLMLPAIELLVVLSLFLGFAFYGRHHLVDGTPRHDLLKLLFFACVFGGAFIVQARLHAILEKRGVFVVEKKSWSPSRLIARFYIGGYGILILSTILMIVIVNL